MSITHLVKNNERTKTLLQNAQSVPAFLQVRKIWTLTDAIKRRFQNAIAKFLRSVEALILK